MRRGPLIVVCILISASWAMAQDDAEVARLQAEVKMLRAELAAKNAEIEKLKAELKSAASPAAEPRAQEESAPTPSNGPVERLVILIDSSQRLAEIYPKIREHVAAEAGRLPEGSSFALIRFADDKAIAFRRSVVMLPADDENRKAALAWLEGLKPGSAGAEVDPRPAFKLAFTLSPDRVIFISDGYFKSEFLRDVKAANSNKVPVDVHVVGEVPGADLRLKMMAAENNGAMLDTGINAGPRPLNKKLYTGLVGTVEEPAVVVQVIDDKSAVVDLMLRAPDPAGKTAVPSSTPAGVEKTTVWLKGTYTAGWATGAKVKLQGAFRVTGAKRYEPPTGGARGVYVLEPVPAGKR